MVRSNFEKLSFVVPHKLLVTNTQVSRFCEASSNCSSSNIKLSKTQSLKIEKSGGFLGGLLGPLLKTWLTLIKNVLKPLVKSVLLALKVIAEASETDVASHRKMFESGITTLIISNKEMNCIMKIVKSLEKSGLLIKNVTQAIKNEAKEPKGKFLSRLLGVTLSGNLLTGKSTFRASAGIIRAGEVTIRAGQNFWCNLIV